MSIQCVNLTRGRAALVKRKNHALKQKQKDKQMKKYSHINARETGSELSIKSFPAWNGEEGSVKLTLRPQKGVISFSDDDCLEFFCTPNDVAHMLGVFRGMDESIRDGKGIYRMNTVMNLEHRIEPYPGYILSIWDKNGEGSRRLQICLDTYEALELSLALEGVMSKLVFGM